MGRPVGIIAALVVLGATCAATALPILGASANTLPAGAVMLDVWMTLQDYRWQYDAGNAEWSELPDSLSFVSTSVVPRVYYGVTDWLTIRASLPLEDRFVDDGVSEDSNTGIGDIVIDPKIRLYQNEARTVRVAFLTGVRLATGDTDGTPAISNGSTGYLFGAGATVGSGDLAGHGYVTYWLNGESASGADVPDMWISCLTVEDRVSESVSVLWEFKWYRGGESFDFERLYACPGVSWDAGRLTVGVAAQIRVAGDGGDRSRDVDWSPYVRAYYRFF